jgi:hypothetical protein
LIVKDFDAKLANRFKALKTPEAFVLNLKNEILYRGGVTDSNKLATAETHFLADALKDIREGRQVKTPFGRAVGCYIQRRSL